MRTLSDVSAAWPDSSNAMTTTAAPYRRTSRARRRNSSSPSFRLIEFTIDLPCTHFSPASSTDHLELSIMIGTRLMSGSAAIRFRNRVIMASPSSSASSMLMSMMTGSGFHLLPGDLDRLVKLLFADQSGELAGSGDVVPLANHHEIRCRDETSTPPGR